MPDAILAAPAVALVGVLVVLRHQRVVERAKERDVVRKHEEDFYKHHRATYLRFCAGGDWAGDQEPPKEVVLQPLHDYLQFFLGLESDLRQRVLHLSTIDSTFAENFFYAMHSKICSRLILHDPQYSTPLLRLYTQWTRFHDRRHMPIPASYTVAASDWNRALQALTADARARQQRLRPLDLFTTGRIQWHPTLHQEIGSARLVFWRLRFDERYEKHQILSFLTDMRASYGIRSYVLYETLGPHDLLLRCWLPNVPVNSTEDEFEAMVDRITAEIRERPLGIECDAFRVRKIWQHWWWDRRGAEPEPPKLRDEDVARVRYEHDTMAEVCDIVDRYNATRHRYWTVRRNREARKYLQQGYIKWRRLQAGIKFATVVRLTEPTADSGTSSMSRHDARTQLGNILQSARNVEDRSLYEGDGFADFLILGRVKPRHFHAVERGIVTPIVGSQALSQHCRTTLTYVSTGPVMTRANYEDRLALSAGTAALDGDTSRGT